MGNKNTTKDQCWILIIILLKTIMVMRLVCHPNQISATHNILSISHVTSVADLNKFLTKSLDFWANKKWEPKYNQRLVLDFDDLIAPNNNGHLPCLLPQPN